MRHLVMDFAVFGCVSLLALSGCGGTDGNKGDPQLVGQAGQSGGDAGSSATGVDGKDGVDGTNGVDGKDGVDGTNGKDGVDGANGANGKDGVDGANGSNGANGTPGAVGKNALVKSSHELAGEHCAYAGIRVESGIDLDSDGVLSSSEVNAPQTQFLCNSDVAWDELAALPAVANAYSFALATNDQDGSPRLGFMFKDDAYRQKLISAGGVLWDGGGVYSGAGVFGVYKLGGELSKTWLPYEGRLTPQTYQYSELSFSAGQSYYTTSFPSFGGLVSVVKGGQTGTYALTPAFTTRKAHSVGFLAGQLFALIAQKTAGLTLSTFPIDKFGNLSNFWTNLATLEVDATTVTDPTVLPAGDRLVAAYVRAGKAYVRASTAPQSVTQPVDFPLIGQVDDATRVSVAWDGSKLYLASISSAGVLTVQRTTIAVDAQWQTVATHVTGAVTDLSLAGKANSVLLAVRQGVALRVFLAPDDSLPSFDAALPGNFSLINAATGPTLAVLNQDPSASHVLRSFQH